MTWNFEVASIYQTLISYLRPFRCCQKQKEGKKKRKFEKKTNIRQNARIKGKETENSIGKAIRTWRQRRRNSLTD